MGLAAFTQNAVPFLGNKAVKVALNPNTTNQKTHLPTIKRSSGSVVSMSDS